jgi:hypothetical protein
MVDKTLPDKSGGAGAGHGTFKEDGTVPKPVVPPKKPAPKAAPPKLPKKGAPLKGGKSASPDPKAAKEKQSGKILANAAKPLAALKAKEALTRGELDKELAKIKGQVSGIEFGVQARSGKWLVIPKAGGKTAKGIEIAAKQIEKGDKDAKPVDGRFAQAFAAVGAVVEQAKAAGAKPAELEMQLPPLRSQYEFKKLAVLQKGNDLEVDAEINPVKVWKYAGTIKMTIIYDPAWPLDEFMSKAKAIQRAANLKQLMTLPIDPITGKQAKTAQERGGEQDVLREKVRTFILTNVTNPKEQNRLLALLALLQADHQLELQMLGKDRPGNLALIEGAMNRELGWDEFRPALRALPPSTIITEVRIDISAIEKQKRKKKKVRTSGVAAQLMAELLKYAHGQEINSVRSWFKLGGDD